MARTMTQCLVHVDNSLWLIRVMATVIRDVTEQTVPLHLNVWSGQQDLNLRHGDMGELTRSGQIKKGDTRFTA